MLCATFISLGVLRALLARMHERVFFKMVAAEPVAAELQWRFLRKQIKMPVLYPTMFLFPPGNLGSSWIPLPASSNQSCCVFFFFWGGDVVVVVFFFFLFYRPATSAEVACSLVFICFLCSLGSTAVTH